MVQDGEVIIREVDLRMCEFKVRWADGIWNLMMGIGWGGVIGSFGSLDRD